MIFLRLLSFFRFLAASKIIIIFTFLFFVACSTTTPKENKLVLFESLGEKFITYLVAEDYKRAQEMLDAEGQKKISSTKLEEIWIKSKENLGDFKKIESTFKKGHEECFKIHFQNGIFPFYGATDKNQKLSAVWFSSQYPTNQKSKYIKSFDNFPLNVLIESNTKTPSHVIVFIHESGTQNWHEGESMLFDNLSKALINQNMATVRYHKRTFEMRFMKATIPDVAKTFMTKDLNNNSLNYFLKDAFAVTKYAQALFPKAKVIILGHGQGTKIALNMNHQDQTINNLALLGSTNNLINATLLEQHIYRNDDDFFEFDKNNNHELTQWELRKRPELIKQFPTLDIDSNKMISLNEWRANGQINFFKAFNDKMKNMVKQELNFPTSYEILKNTKAKILFLHGEWDNQTLIHFPKAIEILNKDWKKDFYFKYFKKTGHSLNIQNNFLEFNNNQIDKTTLSTVISKLKEIF